MYYIPETGGTSEAGAPCDERLVAQTAACSVPLALVDSQSASMTLPSFMKHVHTLERCGLIHTAKSGRVRTCTLNRKRLDVVDGWLAEQRAVWEDRTDRLEQRVTEPQEPS